MLITVGSLTRHADGCLAGVLRTPTIRTGLELRPTVGDQYEVLIGSGFVAGYATSTRDRDRDHGALAGIRRSRPHQGGPARA